MRFTHLNYAYFLFVLLSTHKIYVCLSFMSNLSRVVNKKNGSHFWIWHHILIYFSFSDFSLSLCNSSHTKYTNIHWCRGQAGFDNSGRGYYFANGPNYPDDRDRRPYPEPYLGPAHRPPQPPLPPNQFNHFNNAPQNPPQYDKNQNESQTTTTSRAPPEFYKGKPAQSALIHTVSSNAIGTVDNNSTANSNKNQNHNREINDKEKIR